MKWKKGNNRLDEMQEQKLLRIEHNGCWLAFWGLAAALAVQWCMGAEIEDTAGEWIVFVSLCLYIVAACVKNGIWDRRLAPTPKVNLCASFIAGIVTGGIFFSNSYTEYQAFWGSVATGLFMMGLTTIVCFAAISAVASVYRKRVSRLESEDDK